MLLIYQTVNRWGDDSPWRAVDEVASEEAAEAYIHAHPQQWWQAGDGYGTLFALVPAPYYDWGENCWMWAPAAAKEFRVHPDIYSPY